MKLLLIRHADPDYAADSLTEKGWREAAYLAERLVAQPAAAYYVSPLGRAKDTASLTLQQLHRTAEECPWLREFQPSIERPDAPGKRSICWDWLPQDWLAEPRFLQYDHWFEPAALQAGQVRQEYDWVCAGLDELLARHGYRRQGLYYRAERPSNDTIVLFCHFGVECVLLSHLVNLSPMLLWHGFCAAPSSVTTLATEERRAGVAAFRVLAFGDTAHLLCHGEPPAPAARFCECWQNQAERHD